LTNMVSRLTQFESANEIKPELACQVVDDENGLLGYLVIDRSLRFGACGGVRMRTDVTLEEVAQLARTMTLKFGFMNIDCTGGAKAGIVAPSSLSGPERERVFRAFGKRLSPFIAGGLYTPGADMGTTEKDIAILLQGAGVSVRSQDSQDRTGYYTAQTVYEAVRRAAISLGFDFSTCSVAIEGFGKVGSMIARCLAEDGVRVVGVSTLEGAIYNAKGLDIERLSLLREKLGDWMIDGYTEAERISRNELLALDVDILVPCAGPWTINSENVDQIKAKMIVGGANIPATLEAEEALFHQGKLFVPDFISNCGGVLGSILRGMGFSEHDIAGIVRDDFGAKISKLIELSNLEGITPREVAIRIAQANIQKMEKKMKGSSGAVTRILASVKQKGARGICLRVASRAFQRQIGTTALRALALEHLRDLLHADADLYKGDRLTCIH